jgi:D-sedoheptulose 7-phosphate isomerase
MSDDTTRRGPPGAIADQHREHAEALAAWLPTLERQLPEVARALVDSLDAGGKVLICGNGGSAADAQHMAAELVSRFERERRALHAAALTVDTSALTAIANDYSFERVFSRQVEALGRAGDILVAISTSGRSPNVLAAVETAQRLGMMVLALTGTPGEPLHEKATWSLRAPCGRTARVQELHEFAMHCLCGLVEELL